MPRKCFFSSLFIVLFVNYLKLFVDFDNIYLLKEDFQTMTLNLASLLPQDNAYTFEFSIGNQAGQDIAEVDIEYELTLRTTTNLPLTYELYMNESYEAQGATSIIKENTVSADEDGTYFRTMTTDKITLPYTTGKTNLYQLVVYFPGNYDQEIYQDTIELLEINVNGVQVTDE